MESDCTVLPLPVALDSQNSDLDPIAGLSSTVTSPPQDPASPGKHKERAALVLLHMQEPVGCPLTEDQQPKPQQPDQESMVDSQPILFSENPFVVANRRGKAAGKACLGGPPLGYGQGGVLKTNLYSKAPAGESGPGSSRRDASYSPSSQQASINFIPPQDDSKTLRPPSPPSPEDVPVSVKQAYKTFAAVPLSQANKETHGQTSTEKPKASPEMLSSGGLHSPEQRSFRERQKYFEIEVKQQQVEKPPKRVSLVGEDDLKKMKEEEARKLQQKRALLLEEEEEEEEEDVGKLMPDTSMQSSVIIEGVEYKIKRLNGSSIQSPATRISEADEHSSSQRNSLEEGFKPEQRPNSMSGLIPVYPGGGEAGAPVRTAKAERRHQERLRMQSPEFLSTQEKELSPAERRALEAEKRAMWRAARMKSLEQDALKAQMVIAKSKEGKKRSTLEQLAESPSPAPTPSPTLPEDCSPRNVTSPGRLSMSEKKFDYREFAAIPSSKPVYEIQSPEAVGNLRYVDDTNSTD